MLIAIREFFGLLPKRDTSNMDARQALVASNCDNQTSKATSIQAPSDVATLPATDRLSVYPYNGGYLSWPSDVDVQRSPIAADRFKRIYYTGDGVPKVRGINPVTGLEEEYNLGVQKPSTKPTVAVQDRSTVNWTRVWHYFYEEFDGTQLDPGDLVEGTGSGEVHVVRPGKAFVLPTRPARVTASTSSVFILYFDAYDANGAILGRCYPDISAAKGNSDLYIAGAKISAAQNNGSLASSIVLTFDDSRVADFTVYRSYVSTFVTKWGEEGAPSDPSDTVAVDPSQQAAVNTAQPTGTNTNIDRIRIYRTVTGDAGTAYQFVTELAVGNATYIDDKDDADTGEVLPTQSFDAPPSDLFALVSHPGGFFAALSRAFPRTLYMTFPDQPHAWPGSYAITIDSDGVGLAVSGNGIFILTKEKPELLYGDHPETMTKSVIADPQPCVSKRGIVVNGTVVLYPSPDGYVALEGATTRVVTSDYFSKDEGAPAWKDINPSTIRAAVYDQRLHFWTTSHAFIFGLFEGPAALSTTSETAQGCFFDTAADALLIIQGDKLLKWRGSSAKKVAIRRSCNFQTARPWSPCVCRVTCDTYPATLRLYNQGVLAATIPILDNVARRVPILHDEKFWATEVEFTGTLNEVLLSTSMQELDTKGK